MAGVNGKIEELGFILHQTKADKPRDLLSGLISRVIPDPEGETMREGVL